LVTYIIRRLLLAVIVLIIVSFLSFMLMQMVPGNPVLTMLGLNATPSQIDSLTRELWLDKPVMVQYGHWLNNALHGDFGKSVTMYRDNVMTLIARRLPITLYLSSLALIIATVVGILIGIYCAIKRGSFFDQVFTIMANLGTAVPIFWLGILGIYLFGLKLDWFSIQGFTSPMENLTLSIRQTVMPVFCLSVATVAMMTRQTRSSMLEVIRQDYIRTARSKGLLERTTVMRHALKNALFPVVTLLGMAIPIEVGGSILVETVFNIPGMGRLLVTAAINKDFTVVQAGVLVIGLIVSLANLLVDLSYGWLDPRVYK
jgi:peptide/nickel transport system permease protein